MAALSLNYSDENTIQKSPYKEGAIYVATDTSCIYADLNGERLCLSGESAPEIVFSPTEPADKPAMWIQTFNEQ